ncbi:uncharacterized protein FPRO_10706 [Fusarium proliferatum ET1]|uniref:Uncharacterized protein n=1 Tax=Fusarium proliferatum (strain ET1) TaxID=1227346 RepID=A0A1L7VKN7_FUSPR|nr:uncharacterized protein FPRO_10706 [Fusarium proliferatum ET1]CZR41117.1 uncharacterized protein FPRO_10706 [Fusarium proliferatum ET1]
MPYNYRAIIGQSPYISLIVCTSLYLTGISNCGVSEGPGESPIDKDVECQGATWDLCGNQPQVASTSQVRGGSLEIAEARVCFAGDDDLEANRSLLGDPVIHPSPKQDQASQGIKDKSGMRRDKTWKSQAMDE